MFTAALFLISPKLENKTKYTSDGGMNKLHCTRTILLSNKKKETIHTMDGY